MYELKKIGKVFTSKSVGNGPSSYKKRIYRAAVSQSLRNTGIEGFGGEPLGRKRRRWKDNIEMNLQDVGRGAWAGLI